MKNELAEVRKTGCAVDREESMLGAFCVGVPIIDDTTPESNETVLLRLTSCSPKQALTGHSGAVPGVPALNAACFGLLLFNPGDLNGAIPSNDPYETNFIASGQRNIFRQSWQRRADISVGKLTQLTERFALKYSLDIFNVTNTASFDIPIDDISQNLNFNGFPIVGTPATTTPCNSSFNVNTLYFCPTNSGLGITNKTIGSARQIQMSLKFTF